METRRGHTWNTDTHKYRACPTAKYGWPLCSRNSVSPLGNVYVCACACACVCVRVFARMNTYKARVAALDKRL